MLYPEVDRVSPASIAKSLPVIPRVDPPLSVYLHEDQYICDKLGIPMIYTD